MIEARPSFSSKESTCPLCHTPMAGIAFLDEAGPDGELVGYAVRYCVACADPAGPWKVHPFGQAFRRARQERHVSTANVALALGLFASQVSNVERGMGAPPADEAAVAPWAAAIGMTLPELMARIELGSVRADAPADGGQ